MKHTLMLFTFLFQFTCLRDDVSLKIIDFARFKMVQSLHREGFHYFYLLQIDPQRNVWYSQIEAHLSPWYLTDEDRELLDGAS